MTTITESHLYTAACLWEAAIDAMARAKEPGAPTDNFDARLKSYREGHGTHTVRDDVARMAVACDEAWEALTEREQFDAGCFDWDFVPAWLEENFFRLTRGF